MVQKAESPCDDRDAVQKPADGDQQARVTVFYTRDGRTLEQESEAWHQARDIRATGDDDLIDAETFAACYQQVGPTATIGTDQFDYDASDTIRVLEHVWQRCQGPRRDSVLPYDGSSTRSMAVGDVVVLDGTAYLCASIGFDELGAIDTLLTERRADQ